MKLTNNLLPHKTKIETVYQKLGFFLQTVILKKKQQDGSFLQATFAPSKGMNLISLKKDKIELIDQSTKDLFEERCAGLGALIGPHFYHLEESKLPPPCPETLFPHIPKMIAKGQKDYFSHGIGRYVPWKYQVEEDKILAKLSSVDVYQDHLLSELEGSNFYMTFEATLLDDRLRIHMSCNSDFESVIGLHYYFSLKTPALIEGNVEPMFFENGIEKPLPQHWLNSEQKLSLKLDEELDFGFIPKLDPHSTASLTLKTADYQLEIQTTPENQSELSYQIYKPKESSFVCIEPISAKNPRGTIPKQGNLLIDFLIDCSPMQND